MAKGPRGNLNYDAAPKASTSKPIDKTAKAVERLVKLYEKLNKEASKYVKSMESAGLIRSSGDILNANVPNPFGGKLAIGTQIAFGVGQMAYNMLPNVSTAVSQRMDAQYVSSFSGRGITAASVITRSNAANRGGFTSADSMQRSAAAFMNSGYAFGSSTVGNNLRQLGGMSVISGQTNEEVASGVGSINGMRFISIGIRARNQRGGLRPLNEIANDLYRKMYGSRKPTPEQAAQVLNPNSNAYRTIAMVAGNDPNLMRSLQTAIMAQASNKGQKLNLSDPTKMMDLMGLPKDDPMRVNFQLQTSEAKKLGETGAGLVSGYADAMKTAAVVNDAFTNLARTLGPVTDMFGRLAGFLQTLPQAGTSGPAIAGFGSGVGGGIMDTLSEFASGALDETSTKGQKLIADKIFDALGLGGGGKGGGNGGGGGGGAFFAGGVKGTLKNLKNFKGLKSLKGLKGLKIGGGILAAGLAGFEQFNSAQQGKEIDWGSLLTDTAISAALGFLVGGPVGAAVGAGATLGGAAIGRFAGDHMGSPQGGGKPNTAGNVSTSTGAGSSAFGNPMPGYKSGAWYGKKGPQWSWKGYHTGTDYPAPTGTPVKATRGGKVFDDKPGSAYGISVQVDHGDGTQALYAHLSKKLVTNGQTVKAGQVIGLVGRTGIKGDAGPHLHFEIRKGTNNPVNPNKYLKGGGTIFDGVTGAISAVSNAVTGVVGSITGAIGDAVQGFSNFLFGDSSYKRANRRRAAIRGKSSGVYGLDSSSIKVDREGFHSSGITGITDLLNSLVSSVWEKFSSPSSTTTNTKTKKTKDDDADTSEYSTLYNKNGKYKPSSHKPSSKEIAFAKRLILGLGADPNSKNILAVTTWMRFEGGHFSQKKAKFNPLNTTQPMDGNDPSINSAGVKAYDSWTEGVQATIKTLTGKHSDKYGYSKIIEALRKGTRPQDVLTAVNNSKWGTNIAKYDIQNVANFEGGGQPNTAGNMAAPTYGGTTGATSFVSSPGIGKSVTINMNVNIAKASEADAVRIARQIKSYLETELTTSNIGKY